MVINSPKSPILSTLVYVMLAGCTYYFMLCISEFRSKPYNITSVQYTKCIYSIYVISVPI